MKSKNSETKKLPKLRFPGFDGEWDEIRLGNIVKEMTDFVASGSFASLKQNVKIYDSLNYAIYVRLTDLRKHLNYNELKYVDEFSYKYLTKSNLHGGEILIANIGANVGEVFLMPNIDSKATIAPNMIIIRENKVRYINKFMYFQLREGSGRKSILDVISGSGQPKLSKTDLKSIKLQIPNIPEQQRIASFLTSADEYISNLKSQKEALEKYKKAMMQKIFSQEIRFKDEDRKDYPDWEQRKLGELLDYEQPNSYIVKNTDYNNTYKTPVLTAGKTFILGYTNETSNIFKNLPVILFDDFTTSIQFVDFQFKVKSSAMKILKARNNYNLKFIFEAMKQIEFEIGGHGRHWISVFVNIDI